MSFFKKRLMFLSLCGLILLTGLFYQYSIHPVKEAQQVSGNYSIAAGQKAPVMDFAGLDGETYSLRSFMDKPLLITFFASWCGICQQELPKLSSYFEENKEKLNIVAINATTQEYRKDDVKEFVQEARLSMPVLLDEEGKGLKSFHVTGVPVSFFIDEHGFVRQTFYGPISREQLEAEL